jgi:DNA-directed RNA polymerase specialized sigma24 family protein
MEVTLLRPSSFAQLLKWLSEDPGRAGEEYERMRRKLILFFEGSRWGVQAADLTDRAVDIVARRLEEGVVVSPEKRMAFVLGVARNVLRDQLKAPKHASMDREVAAPEREETTLSAQRFRCFEHCLVRALSESERELILSFYQGERKRKIQNRSEMACRLGISAEALRSRMHRIRGRLERCIRECMQSSPSQ